MGFGCNVPAIMATRTIENPKDRLVTIMAVPLMSCGARLPIYALFAAAFFPSYQGLVVFFMYAIGIILAVPLIWIFRKRLVAGESGHFVMELHFILALMKVCNYKLQQIIVIYATKFHQLVLVQKFPGVNEFLYEVVTISMIVW